VPHYLLSGAGFSRNWGGWLANEAFEFLLSADEVDAHLRNVLWDAKLRGEGFEGAFAAVQSAFDKQKSAEAKQHLDKMTRAIISLFSAMQAAFNKFNYRDHNHLQTFLARFDGVFTLNQDTFLETVYAGPVRWNERWYGSYLPYMKFIEQPEPPYPFMLRGPLMPDQNLTAQENYQPIYKLHGSHNWFSEPEGERMLVLGGNKSANIGSSKILARYQTEFQRMLHEPETHLMIIGYSFSDSHINQAIQAAVEKGFKLFLIDPLGVDVLDKRSPKAQIPEPVSDMMRAMIPGIIGASRRPIIDILNGDQVENDKVMNFFKTQPAHVRIAEPEYIQIHPKPQ
jgi:hypothetical protein